VIAYYIAGAISLGRAAELLELPWIDLRTRLHRLGVPIRVGPETVEELRAEVEALKVWEEQQQNRL
jgi:predicted HTH domain antitoxin